MQNNWIKVTDALPEFYEALGIKISEFVLVADAAQKTTTIASLWRDDKDTWRSFDGGQVKPTHWQYIKLPKVTDDN